jgi:hypothetical protein
MERHTGGSTGLGKGEHVTVFRFRVRGLWVSVVDRRRGERHAAKDIFSERELPG